MTLTARIALLLLLPLAACGDGARHGQIVGDAFLVVDMGREVDLAGLPVHLVAELEDEDSTARVEQLDTILANICVQRDRFLVRAREAAEGGGTAAADSLAALTRDAYDRGWRARDRLLREGVVKTVHAGPRAQFVIDSIEPAEYRLWADTVIDAQRWSWLQPVEVEAGDSIRVNLNNANVDENPFRCKSPG